MNNAPSPVTVRGYYKSLRGASTALAAVVLPLVSKFVGSEPALYLFPPLGTVDGIGRFALICLGLLMSVGVYFLIYTRHATSPVKLVWIASILAFLFLTLYLASYQRFVRRIDVPSTGSSIYVSVGYRRTPFAEQTFGTASDWDMLRARGTSEEAIEQLWTETSLMISRLCLFFSCSLSMLALLFIFNFVVTYSPKISLPSAVVT